MVICIRCCCCAEESDTSDTEVPVVDPLEKVVRVVDWNVGLSITRLAPDSELVCVYDMPTPRTRVTLGPDASEKAIRDGARVDRLYSLSSPPLTEPALSRDTLLPTVSLSISSDRPAVMLLLVVPRAGHSDAGRTSDKDEEGRVLLDADRAWWKDQDATESGENLWFSRLILLFLLRTRRVRSRSGTSARGSDKSRLGRESGIKRTSTAPVVVAVVAVAFPKDDPGEEGDVELASQVEGAAANI
jgi:hypothetical protein